jgi:hypothetical protein
MKIINRGFLFVKPTKYFFEWANAFMVEEIEFTEKDDCEASIYLIEEDFFDIEPIIEKNFKKILKNEMQSVTEDKENWPQKIDIELFHKWFSVDAGTSVFDCLKEDLISEKID